MTRAGVVARSALLLAFAAGAGAEDAAPRTYALVVGCTEYPLLEQRLGEEVYRREVRLLGPANDVALFTSVLKDRLGVPAEAITTLVGWAPDQPLRTPTRQNVLRQLVRLSRRAKRGDRVVVFLAGHGSQEPDASGDESDGLDEIFLPADASSWDGERKHVTGSISDDEIGERLRAIRDAGATVWFVMDSCHAGSAMRGGDGGTRIRSLSPTRLGAPGAPRRTAAGAAQTESDEVDSKGIGAIYASRADQKAPEMLLPRGDPNATWHGLLTYAIASELAHASGFPTVADLGARLLGAYRAFPYHGCEPVASGDLSLRVNEGAAQGLPPPPSTAEPSLETRLRIGAVDATGQALRLEDLPAEAAAFFREEGARARFPFVGETSVADWLLVVPPAAGPLALRPALLGGGDDTPFLVAPTTMPSTLARVARVENLKRLAFGGAVAALDAGMSLEIRRVAGGRETALPENGVFHPGETAKFVLRNSTGKTYDVWLFVLDGSYGVTCLWPAFGQTPRLLPEDREPIEMAAAVNDRSLGEEHLLLLALPKVEGALPADLRWLEGPPLERVAARSRGPAAGGVFGDLLAAAAFGGDLPDARARSGVLGNAAGRMRVFSWRTAWEDVGPPEAFPHEVVLRREAAPGAGSPEDYAAEMWRLGPNVTVAKSGPETPGYDVLLAGGERPEEVLFDLRGGFASRPDADALVRGLAERSFRPDVAFHFLADRRIVYYDRDGDGSPDLVLEDRDDDPEADARAVLSEGRWTREEGLNVPWLSAAYLGIGDEERYAAAVTALRFLVREPSR